MIFKVQVNIVAAWVEIIRGSIHHMKSVPVFYS
jgi:hypothetical protein